MIVGGTAVVGRAYWIRSHIPRQVVGSVDSVEQYNIDTDWRIRNGQPRTG